MTSPFRNVAENLNIQGALKKGAEPNDLLPPRPEDRTTGEVGKRFSETLHRELTRGNYDPTPAYIVFVPKSSSATRPAALLTLSDRVVYEAIVDAFRKRLDAFLLGVQILFWPRGLQSPKQWRDFEHSPLLGSEDYMVIADISAFYESVDHERLAERLIRATGRRQEAEALVAFLDRVMGSSRGLPQGLEPSDPLATAYLSQVDFAMVRDGFRYSRHGDDIRIAAPDYNAARRAVFMLEARVREAGLLLSGAKTKILKRATYEKELLSIDETLVETRRRLMDLKASTIANDKEALSEAIEEAEREQLGWDFFYHGRLSLHEVIEELRPHLEPSDTEVAEQLFLDTVARIPGSENSLPADAFHQRLIASLVRLAAAGSDVALPHIGNLLIHFPDKTELLCSYLMSLATTAPTAVEEQVREVFAGGRFRTEWESAWAIRTLDRVYPHVSAPILAELERIIAAPHGYWLAAVEAAKLLGKRHQLSHDTLSRLWNLCPRVFQADLVVAADSMSPSHSWAEAFVKAAQDDPIHVVVARHLKNRTSQDVPISNKD